MTDLQESVRTKADELASWTREAWHERGLDEKAAAAAAALAAAGMKIKESGLDEKAAELAQRLRDSKSAQQAGDIAREYGDRVVDRLGLWLQDTNVGERLGLQPPKRKRRGRWLLLLLAVAAGVAAALAAKSRQGGGPTLETAGPQSADLEPSSEISQRPLADKVRTALGEDPRTKDLPERLNINVVEGTVFVRGPVPEGYDEEQLRQVVAGVEGVTDVDLQVTRLAQS